MAISAVKSGVVGTAENVAVIAAALRGLRAPYVLDPVAMASSGKPLIGPAAIEAITAQLFPLATLITPNALEASALCGIPVRTRDDAVRAGRALLASGCGAVLVKGGHLVEDDAVDVLVTRNSVSVFESPRIANPNTHGTGCTLASAIAARLASGYELAMAVRLGREFVGNAIRAGYRVGGGPGPVDQLWGLREQLQVSSAPRRESEL
jgi:hydroxymethylpyrimidine/phosphomethylpyrimidine kinase